VGAYYYPWHGDDSFRDEGYLRENINQLPVLGEYNEGDPSVIAQHVAWSQQANIQLWVTSWKGPRSREDTCLLEDILTQPAMVDSIKIALHYEMAGRIYRDETVRFARIAADIRYICENYFSRSNYFQIDENPVLVVNLTRKLERDGVLVQLIQLMRSTAADYSYELYIIGDYAFGRPRGDGDIDPDPGLEMLDAITNYDIYGSFREKGYTGQDGVDQYFDEQEQWMQLCATIGCDYIPGVSPGFNDRGVRLEMNHTAIARKLSPDAEPGSLFRASLKRAVEHVQASTSNLLLVNSFNEWHEDSQIEPVTGEATSEPVLYTQGIEYVGYGELYLDILREMTVYLFR
jgi:glycoprotein endo-alpha-1,2-mannosidase